eukprot:scaffold201415_cov30-Tisochrysis_lutea.AAC.1
MNMPSLAASSSHVSPDSSFAARSLAVRAATSSALTLEYICTAVALTAGRWRGGAFGRDTKPTTVGATAERMRTRRRLAWRGVAVIETDGVLRAVGQ